MQQNTGKIPKNTLHVSVAFRGQVPTHHVIDNASGVGPVAFCSRLAISIFHHDSFMIGSLGVNPEYLDLQDPAKSRISGWVSRADFWAQDFFAINKIEI